MIGFLSPVSFSLFLPSPPSLLSSTPSFTISIFPPSRPVRLFLPLFLRNLRTCICSPLVISVYLTLSRGTCGKIALMSDKEREHARIHNRTYRYKRVTRAERRMCVHMKIRVCVREYARALLPCDSSRYIAPGTCPVRARSCTPVGHPTPIFSDFSIRHARRKLDVARQNDLRQLPFAIMAFSSRIRSYCFSICIYTVLSRKSDEETSLGNPKSFVKRRK